MFRAKKSLGQNFLKSKKVLNKIVEAAQISKDETILEIGPGKGTLTKELVEAGAKVIAIEKDDRLIEDLSEKFQGTEIIHGDALEFNPKDIEGDYKLVANIPYYITGEIIEKFLSADHQPSLMVSLVQKEVAERIVAKDGKESILSISVKAYGKPKYVSTVSKRYFAPAPKVDSAIISIENISKDNFSNISEEKFFNIVKTGFAHKRKKVLSNLKEKFDISKLDIPENSRAEELSVEKWLEIASTL